jgi:UDP-N-acetylglucosamine 1-carboxyvinyltransferase
MNTFIIEGCSHLKGEINVSGNKNSALPIIAASFLTDEELLIENVPNITDVRNMLEIASALGASANFAKGRLRIRAKSVKTTQIPKNLCSKIRTSILFVGPLLARCGSAKFANPGGDGIGRRRLDAHFYGLRCLGAKLAAGGAEDYFIKAPLLRGRELFFDEASVTATEHVMMTAVLARGRTIIRNAAAEPHVRELGELLSEMGALISGLGTDTITIDGVEKLHGAKWKIRADHIEAGSFLALAAASGGDITVKGVTLGNFWMTRRVFEKFSVKIDLRENFARVSCGQKLKIKPDVSGATPIISDGPWPQYPTDMMSCSIVMATQAMGSVLFFEKMFEARMFFVDRLISMGANAIVCDPHRVLITGPSVLRGMEMSSPDIRAGMALIIASLCAKGRSTIRNADVILRGYENIVGKLESVNAKIIAKKTIVK